MSATNARALGYVIDAWGQRLPGRIKVPVQIEGGLPELPSVVEVEGEIYLLRPDYSPTSYEYMGRPKEATRE